MADEPIERRRIEIVHESLLTAWPRLVRWQTQDIEGAQLRDELRQAARTWHERGRSDDLLWSGTAFREYQLWREHYPGGLSEIEEGFGEAMSRHALRRKRRRHTVVALVIVLSLSVAAVTGGLWRRSETERRRAEASKLVALGRGTLDTHHTGALAYAIKSLELADSPEARRFALETLWRGPPARLLSDQGSLTLAFSPDGRWLATGRNRLQLVQDDGGSHPPLGRYTEAPHLTMYHFSANADLVLRISRQPAETDPWAPVVERWWLPGLQELPVTEWNRRIYLEPTATGLIGFEPLRSGTNDYTVRRWSSPPFPYELGAPEPLGKWLNPGIGVWAPWWVDPTGSHLLWVLGRELLLRPLAFSDDVADIQVTEHAGEVRRFQFSPDGSYAASFDESEELRVFSLQGDRPKRLLTLTGGESPDPLSSPMFSPDTTRMAMVSKAEKAVYLWDLETPLDGRPLVLHKSDEGQGYAAAFDPKGRWLATLHGFDIAFWPMAWPYYSRPIPAWPGVDFLGDLGFTADSHWLLGCGGQRAESYRWPLARGLGDSQPLPGGDCIGLALDPARGRALVSGIRGKVSVRDITTGEERILKPPDQGWFSVGLDTERQRMAAAPYDFVRREDALLRVWNESGEVRELDLLENCAEPTGWHLPLCLVTKIRFTPEGHLVTGGPNGIRLWDLENGRTEWIIGPEPTLSTRFDLTADGRFLLVQSGHLDIERRGVADLQYVWYDLEQETRRPLRNLPETGGPNAHQVVALDQTGTIYAIGGLDGALYVGSVSGGPPHLLLGGQGEVYQVAISPNGRWIASRTQSEIRLWPMPDVSKPPLHTLARSDLLAKLRSFTNLRVVESPGSLTGWKLDVGSFPGWEEVPEW